MSSKSFRTQSEMWSHLLTGGKIQFIDEPLYIVWLGEDGNLEYENRYSYVPSTPRQWAPYEKPKWYETAKPGAVLCWMSEDGHPGGTLRLFHGMDNDGFYLDEAGLPWRYAEPLTKTELQVFLDAAPEEV